MDSKKGLVTFFPAILLAFALFAFVAMIFLVANVLFAESQQEAVIYNLRNVDDDLTLQAFLRYNYHGKMLGDWLVLGAGMKDKQAEATFSEGFKEYFRGMPVTAVAKIYVNNNLYKSVSLNDYFSSLSPEQKDLFITSGRNYEEERTFTLMQAKERSVYEGIIAHQKLPYGVEIRFAQMHINLPGEKQ